MDLNEYQRRASVTDQMPRPDAPPSGSLRDPRRFEVVPLLGLVGEVGGLLGEYKKLLRDGATHRGFRDEVAEELGDILWYVANVAAKFDLRLDEIAAQNIEKIEDRWGPLEGPRRLYDDHLPEDQKLPRRFAYAFEERSINGVVKVVLVDQLAGGTTGAPLTDNAYEDDGYRFHDVLHLAFAACLGWSPVLRKLLRSDKRLAHRTPPEVDEVEDGGRAQVIEEAIVAEAYVYASSHDYLEDVDAVDWQLLRNIKRLTAHTEVGTRTSREWNDTLLRGFAIWRKLRTHRAGVVRGDLLEGALEFSPPQR